MAVLLQALEGIAVREALVNFRDECPEKRNSE